MRYDFDAVIRHDETVFVHNTHQRDKHIVFRFEKIRTLTPHRDGHIYIAVAEPVYPHGGRRLFDNRFAQLGRF